MDDQGKLTNGPNAALVILAFLQADCKNSEYNDELRFLQEEIHPTRDINCCVPRKDALDDGDLECDGHLPSCITASLDDIQPSVQWPIGNLGDAEAVQQIAGELREIAAQLEHNVVARATQNLRRNISESPSHPWKNHLTREVEWVIRQGVGLEHLPQERVILALTLTLVKGVCEQAPRLLRELFSTALQYISPARVR